MDRRYTYVSLIVERSGEKREAYAHASRATDDMCVLYCVR